MQMESVFVSGQSLLSWIKTHWQFLTPWLLREKSSGFITTSTTIKWR